jgi:hypothetical protein
MQVFSRTRRLLVRGVVAEVATVPARLPEEEVHLKKIQRPPDHASSGFHVGGGATRTRALVIHRGYFVINNTLTMPAKTDLLDGYTGKLKCCDQRF